mmetsp:Transcript_69044/g.108896  ORF Transcript_69044/g.108896 Transcript_69044/m.108896 type:complete len:233 (-) Transcript_69044:976-1674(-)
MAVPPNTATLQSRWGGAAGPAPSGGDSGGGSGGGWLGWELCSCDCCPESTTSAITPLAPLEVARGAGGASCAAGTFCTFIAFVGTAGAGGGAIAASPSGKAFNHFSVQPCSASAKRPQASRICSALCICSCCSRRFSEEISRCCSASPRCLETRSSRDWISCLALARSSSAWEPFFSARSTSLARRACWSSNRSFRVRSAFKSCCDFSTAFWASSAFCCNSLTCFSRLLASS